MENEMNNLSALRLLASYEVFDYTPEMIKESRELNGGKIVLKGILQKADTVNQNGRIYPRHILEREIRNYQKFIVENRAIGEIDHPDTSVINLKNVSHKVIEARFQDNVVMGAIEILNTPSGKILQDLLEGNVKLGISSRGVGTVQKRGDYHEVQEDFQLICFDAVSEPSTPGAFLIPEGKIITSQELKETFNRSDRIDRILNEILYKQS
jgi:hypothetical protein